MFTSLNLTRLSVLFVAVGALASACDSGDATPIDHEAERAACLGQYPAKAGPGVQETWGAACETDAECKTLLGNADAVCSKMAVVYEMPGGMCSVPCDLNAGEYYRADDPTCDPAGGVMCIGVDGTFERCTKACTSDADCTREGFTCRTMPQLGKAGDPTFCLPPDCCEGTCECSDAKRDNGLCN